MITMAKGVLKAKMLEVFRQIEETGEELVVTDHSRPVLRVTPIYRENDAEKVFGDLRGKLVLHEPMNTPTLSEWGDV
jgi:antitoxin (DNA-binding transcriptional repressor) of toxin-antitoxin stability system